MTKFTKERLEEIAELARKATYKPCAMHMTNLLAVCGSEAIEEMARQLLAGMEQGPVAWQWFYYKQWLVTNDPQRAKDVAEGGDVTVQPLYAAPQLPQPAVPEKAITQHFDTIALDTAKMVMCDVNRRDEFLGGDIQLLSRIQCRIDEACRAAMLQGAEPESQPYTLRDGKAEALSEAVAAIYFADSSDYFSALWSVVRSLSPETAELLENDEKTAFDATRLPAAPQQEVK